MYWNAAYGRFMNEPDFRFWGATYMQYLNIDAYRYDDGLRDFYKDSLPNACI